MIRLIEDDLIAQVRALLGAQLRTVDSLPGELSQERLRELTRTAPSVYFAWLGGRQRPQSSEVEIEGVWGMYVFTAHASGHTARRHGRGDAIGAYEILQIVLPVLNGYTIADVGTVSLRRVENLFNLRLERREAAALYAAVFDVPMPLDYQADLTALESFRTYHAEHSLAPGEDEPDAIDNVPLPQ